MTKTTSLGFFVQLSSDQDATVVIFIVGGTVGWARDTKVDGLGLIPWVGSYRRLEKWKLWLVHWPAPCSALMGGCKREVHTRCCHWLDTSAAFIAKTTAWPKAQANGDGRRKPLVTMGAILLQNVGGSLVQNQCGHRVDAEVTFYIYSFPALFQEVFWEQY